MVHMLLLLLHGVYQLCMAGRLGKRRGHGLLVTGQHLLFQFGECFRLSNDLLRK
jgi:hypothetical protein